MRDGALRTGAVPLSPAAPRGARVLSLAAAVVLHGAMVLAAFWLAFEPMVADAPAIEVDLIVEAPGPATEAIEAAAESESAMPEATPPKPTPPEPPISEMVDASPPAAEPLPEVVDAAPLPEPALPMPPRRRPTPLSPAAVVETPRAAPSAAPVATEAPSVAVVPPPTSVARPEGDYVSALLGWLERHKDYPRAARLRRIEGTAIVRLAILADGRLGALSLARSSGHPVLDEASLDMVRRAAPLPRPPGPIDLDVPVVFAQSAR